MSCKKNGEKISNVSESQVDPFAWWRDARFGMFIHWGLYAVTAGYWKGEEQAGIGEWIQGHFKIPSNEYKKLADQFNPVDFDAAAIVKMAKDTGMKYLVITTKHHDGFAMYDSSDDYSIVKATPYGKDPVRALSEECQKQGIVFCLYYSQDLDWAHPDGGGNTWDYPKENKNFQRYLDEKCKPQLKELLTNYGPIGLIWFDMAQNITDNQALEIRELVKSIQPNCLISGRIGGGYGDYGNLGDNQVPAGRMIGDWECPATLNNTWGYKEQDHNWKSVDTILYLLVDLVAKGVNYLVNIGPDALGRVPEESGQILSEVGEWMAVNGEAIYGTQAGPYPYELDWGRITIKDNALYLFIYKWPSDKFALYGIKNKVIKASLLADESQTFNIEQEDDEELGVRTLFISLSDNPQTSRVPVIKLELDGSPEIDSSLVQNFTGDIFLPAIMANVHVLSDISKRKASVESNWIAAVKAEEANDIETENALSISSAGMIQNWFSTEDWLDWEFIVAEPGKYMVELHTVAPKYVEWCGGHQVSAQFNGTELIKEVMPDEAVTSPRTYHFEEYISRLGILEITSAGKNTIQLKALIINSEVNNGLCVSDLNLIPVTGSSAPVLASSTG